MNKDKDNKNKFNFFLCSEFFFNMFYIITFIGKMKLAFFKTEQLRTRIVFIDQTKSYIAIRKFSLNNIYMYIQIQTFDKHFKQCFKYQAP